MMFRVSTGEVIRKIQVDFREAINLTRSLINSSAPYSLPLPNTFRAGSKGI
jgi:hypothetical protein